MHKQKNVMNDANFVISGGNRSFHNWYLRADTRFASSQWEMLLQSNAISHWLGTNLESVLHLITISNGSSDDKIGSMTPHTAMTSVYRLGFYAAYMDPMSSVWKRLINLITNSPTHVLLWQCQWWQSWHHNNPWFSSYFIGHTLPAPMNDNIPSSL